MSAVTDVTEWLRLRCREVLELIGSCLDLPVGCFEIENWDPPVDEEPEDEDADRYDEDGNPMRRSEDESGAGGGW